MKKLEATSPGKTQELGATGEEVDSDALAFIRAKKKVDDIHRAKKR